MEKTEAFQTLMKNLNYFDRILNRYQSLPRWYGPDLLLYSSEADLLAEALGELGKELDAVVYFKVSDEILLKRLTARQNCRQCGEIYNKLYLPSKVENVCDKCGGELFQRPDDSLETAQKRLAVFYEQTAPLIDYYEKLGKLLTIAELDKGEITRKLMSELE